MTPAPGAQTSARRWERSLYERVCRLDPGPPGGRYALHGARRPHDLGSPRTGGLLPHRRRVRGAPALPRRPVGHRRDRPHAPHRRWRDRYLRARRHLRHRGGGRAFRPAGGRHLPHRRLPGPRPLQPEVVRGAEDLLAFAGRLQGFRWVDLSHTLEEGIPAWPTHARFGRTLYESYELGDVARHYGLTMSEHTGTHIDAPLHFIQRGAAHYGIDEVPLHRLAGRAATIEAPELPRSGLLTAAHVREWEEEYGSIEELDVVLVRYGWDRRWGTGAEGTSFLE